AAAAGGRARDVGGGAGAPAAAAVARVGGAVGLAALVGGGIGRRRAVEERAGAGRGAQAIRAALAAHVRARAAAEAAAAVVDVGGRVDLAAVVDGRRHRLPAVGEAGPARRGAQPAHAHGSARDVRRRAGAPA